MTPFQMLEEFHWVYGLSINEPFGHDLLSLREKLLKEEYDEVMSESLVFPDMVDKKKLTKELADLMYVTIGFATTFGLPLEAVLAETHKSNMSKLGDDGKPIYREDGKVLKGPNYKEPNLDQFFP